MVGLDIGGDRGQEAVIGARQRQEKALGQAQLAIAAHLLESLQRRGAGIRDIAGMSGRGEIAGAEPGIVMGWAHDPVEIDLDERHTNLRSP